MKIVNMTEDSSLYVSGEGPSRILTPQICLNSGHSSSSVLCIRLRRTNLELSGRNISESPRGLLTSLHTCTSPQLCASKCIQYSLSLNSQQRTVKAEHRGSLGLWLPLIVHMYCGMWPLFYLCDLYRIPFHLYPAKCDAYCTVSIYYSGPTQFQFEFLIPAGLQHGTAGTHYAQSY